MKAMRLLIAALFTASISTSNLLAASKTIAVDGSSTVYPITEAMAEEFQIENKGTHVTVGISGTGGGFKKFCRGEIDISDASRPIKEKEMELCKEAKIEYVELPVAFDAITVMVNPKNDWVNEITVEELKKIWHPDAQAKITTWKQVNPKWPDEPLTLYAPGTDSGTYDYFSTAICGKKVGTRGDFTASEDDNVLVQGISNDKNALGFFGFSYYVENQDKLKAVPIIDSGASKSVAPSAKTIENGSYQPLSRPIFLYVRKDSLAKPEVTEFIEFYMSHPELVTEVGYVTLPPFAYKNNLKRIKKKTVGTVFGGKSKTGVTAQDLYKTEPSL